MTLIADAQGNLEGKFTIPPGIPAGEKLVAFEGAGGAAGVAIFSGQGTLTRQTWQQQTTVTETRWQSPPPPTPVELINILALQVGVGFVNSVVSWMPQGVDPLAQTFSLAFGTQIGGVELWFTAAPTTTAIVQVRETTVGFPNSTVVAESRLEPADINDDGTVTRFVFDGPVTLIGGREYAIVVMCNDATGELAVAEIGKFDADAQRWITAQPYNVGVLLSSSNASTWTPHQDRDMAFRLLRLDYSAVTRTIPLGKVAVADTTDLLLMSYAETPTSQTRVQYALTLPDSSVITVSDGQPVRLATPITGDVLVAAILSGDDDFSPVLHPGAQVVAGEVATSADYVTRAIPAGTGVTLKVIFDAEIPSGAGVTVQYSGIDGGDTFATIPVSSSSALDAPFHEFIHTVTPITETAVRIKLILDGTPAARPRVKNLRVIVS